MGHLPPDDGGERVSAPIPRPATEIAPGAVHVPGWLTLDEQRELVALCQVVS